MKRIVLFLFLFSLSFAIYPGNVTITPFESKDFGNDSLPAFNVTLTADCLAVDIIQYTSSQGTPVSGAMGYLKQVQYAAPLISSKSTDSKGYAVHMLPGNISFYTGLFTLTIQKTGYREKELHFDISGCFVNVTEPGTGNGTPPSEPGCKTDDDCLSSEMCNVGLGKCEKISGTCGYAFNHQWFGYECCSDADCGSSKYCDNLSNQCLDRPAGTNGTANASGLNTTIAPNVTAGCTADADCPVTVNCSANETYIAPTCLNGTCIGEKCKTTGAPSACPIGFALLFLSALAIGRYNAH